MATHDHAIHDAEEESYDYNSAFPALPMATAGGGPSPATNSWAGTNKFSVRTSRCTQVCVLCSVVIKLYLYYLSIYTLDAG